MEFQTNKKCHIFTIFTALGNLTHILLLQIFFISHFTNVPPVMIILSVIAIFYLQRRSRDDFWPFWSLIPLHHTNFLKIWMRQFVSFTIKRVTRNLTDYVPLPWKHIGQVASPQNLPHRCNSRSWTQSVSPPLIGLHPPPPLLGQAAQSSCSWPARASRPPGRGKELWSLCRQPAGGSHLRPSGSVELHRQTWALWWRWEE